MVHCFAQLADGSRCLELAVEGSNYCALHRAAFQAVQHAGSERFQGQQQGQQHNQQQSQQQLGIQMVQQQQQQQQE